MEELSRLSRRRFIAGSAGMAAGAAVLTGPVAGAATAASLPMPLTRGRGRGRGRPVDGAIVLVRDAARGQLVLLVGTEEYTFTNKGVVAALEQATRGRR